MDNKDSFYTTKPYYHEDFNRFIRSNLSTKKVARVGISFIRTFKNGEKQQTIFKNKSMIRLLKDQGYKIKYVN